MDNENINKALDQDFQIRIERKFKSRPPDHLEYRKYPVLIVNIRKDNITHEWCGELWCNDLSVVAEDKVGELLNTWDDQVKRSKLYAS